LTARKHSFDGYRWVGDFWNTVIADRSQEGRSWWVVSLTQEDLFLRDAVAHMQARDALEGREDAQFHFAPAWLSDQASAAPKSNVDILFLGRPKPFNLSQLAKYASYLEQNMFHRIRDPASGEAGKSFKFGDLNFSSRALMEPDSPHPRLVLDYGLLLYRRYQKDGEDRRLVSIAGLGSLGTLGLAVLLANRARRRELQQQAESLLPSASAHQPDLWAELSVRIEVEGEEQLAGLLRGLEGGGVPFSYGLQTVALPTRSGRVVYRATSPVGGRLELRAASGAQEGGWVRPAGAHGWIELSPKQFRLIELIAENPGAASTKFMAQQLRSPEDPSEPGETQRRRLAKLVHDTNASLRRGGFAAGVRVIHYSKKRDTYVLGE
jgi:hypothetical protein